MFYKPDGQSVRPQVHAYNIIQDYPNMYIHVGTDSIYKNGVITYIEVIAFRFNNGAQYIYRKTKTPSYRTPSGKPDVFMKLWQEARLTIELAEFLRSCQIEVDVVEFDYNHVATHESNKLISSALGWASGLGFNSLYKSGFGEQGGPECFVNMTNSKYKPNYLIAVKAADAICRNIHY